MNLNIDLKFLRLSFFVFVFAVELFY